MKKRKSRKDLKRELVTTKDRLDYYKSEASYYSGEQSKYMDKYFKEVNTNGTLVGVFIMLSAVALVTLINYFIA